MLWVFSVGRGGGLTNIAWCWDSSFATLFEGFSGIHFFYYLYFPFPSLLNVFFFNVGGFIQCPVGGYVETHQLSLYSCIINESTALMSYHAFLAATLRFSSQCNALFYILVILIDPFLLFPFSNIQQLRC